MGKDSIMGLRMIQCGRQTVRVIQPDGQVRQHFLPIKVSDLLLMHPHHYVSQATNKRRSILPLDTRLESGSMYILLPLPRLFPCSSPSVPHACSCLWQPNSQAAFTTIRCEFKRRYWSLSSYQSSKISPEMLQAVSANAKSSALVTSIKQRRLWEPSLDIISEDRLLLQSKDELESALLRKKKKKDKAKTCQ
eukprot:Gb_20618 [translate_table: standard]